ncbi:hypothetical protein DTU20_15655 [Salmonella enterica subsp. enterica serovar Westhampton]|uniref:Uncharacterized protein n=1 Tax=Salmonella enterica TaxID=28901 RepID=A0A5U4S9T1_SALER|nr:hypothetical protein [Salmonella enterica subsp. enterica serovar Aba]EBQ1674784.1 hypothetical protein [Salmonella enterica]EBX8652495.1 hypothetical protein [Salmonella enterica subsp. enterica serovar Westhampton]EBY6261096.1 hypothetical protein [Salmonella enterica subsp. enterica serovar Warnow]EHA8895004.1 hypothetical protein [Salmonella enterica subsp. enterica]
MRISNISENTDFLSHQFPEVRFLLFKSEPYTYISCFVCLVDDELELLRLWKKVVSVIAYDYQANFEQKFEAWNIYLVFVCSGPVSKKNKYEIENDKFSMRKMVVENAIPDFDIERYLNNEILGANLKLGSIFSYVPMSENDDVTDLQKKLYEFGNGKRSGLVFTSEDIINLADWIINNEN